MHFIEDKQSAGFTLIELMIALAITGILSAALGSIFQAQVRGQISQDVSLKMTQSVRATIELMASDIRMAGCDPTEGSGAGFLLADDGVLHLTMDTTGGPLGEPDGDTNDANEDVRYAINAGLNLGREVGAAGGLQPLHSIDMECDVLNFVYLDANGNVMATPVLAVNLGNISAVQVSVIIRSADAANPGFLTRYTDTHSYVNLQGVEILAPPNDTFRRFQLSNTIACRNL
jgi:type IV pilus assembly protein PilW